MTSRLLRPFHAHRRWSALVVALWIGACASGAAWAGDGRPGRGGARGPMMHGGAFGGRAMRQDRAARGAVREAAPQPQPVAPPIERPPEAAPVDRGGRPGRLTPDERRALRQQINDAGREIYRAPRP